MKKTNFKYEYIIASIGILAVLTIISRSLTIISAGTVATTELFGQVRQKSLPPGIHLINPFSKVVQNCQ